MCSLNKSACNPGHNICNIWLFLERAKQHHSRKNSVVWQITVQVNKVENALTAFSTMSALRSNQLHGRKGTKNGETSGNQIPVNFSSGYQLISFHAFSTLIKHSLCLPSERNLSSLDLKSLRRFIERKNMPFYEGRGLSVLLLLNSLY